MFDQLEPYAVINDKNVRCTSITLSYTTRGRPECGCFNTTTTTHRFMRSEEIYLLKPKTSGRRYIRHCTTEATGFYLAEDTNRIYVKGYERQFLTYMRAESKGVACKLYVVWQAPREALVRIYGLGMPQAPKTLRSIPKINHLCLSHSLSVCKHCHIPPVWCAKQIHRVFVCRNRFRTIPKQISLCNLMDALSNKNYTLLILICMYS